MLRHPRVLAAGAGLCLSLAQGGCLGSFDTVRPVAATPVASAPAHDEEHVSSPAPPVVSPYHPAPVPPPTVGALPRAAQVEQAHYPVLLPSRDVPLRPPTLPEGPAAPPAVVQAAPPAEAVPVAASITPPDPRPQPPEEPPLLAALRCYLSHRPAEALALLEHYDKLNQDMLLALLPVASRLTEGSLQDADPLEVAGIMSQLGTLQDLLRVRAPLVMDKICFVRRIAKFGDYEPLPDAITVFKPGDWVEVYAELQNFTCTFQGGRYVTRLASAMKIRDFDDQKLRWHQDSASAPPDLSRSPRRDFHMKATLQVPDDLPPGPYTLWFSVTDVPTGRTISKTLDFRVTTLPMRRS